MPNDPTASPADSTPAAPEPQTPPAQRRRSNGKVAQLPQKVRDRLGELLLDGFNYKEAIEELGQEGKDLVDDNLANWRKYGGFATWQAEYETRQALRGIHQRAAALNEGKPATTIQDAGRALASGQVYELLQAFDPRSFAPNVTDKPELYLRLVTAVARLSEAESLCAHRRVQQALAELKLDRPEAFDPKRMYTGEQLKEILRHIKVI